MSSVFCSSGLSEARKTLFTTVREHIPASVINDAEIAFDAVFDDCVEEATDAAINWSNDNLDEAVSETLNNLEVDQLPDDLRTIIVNEHGGLQCPTCSRGRIHPETAGALTCSSCRRTFTLTPLLE